MKQTYNKAQQRSFRRWVRQLFTSWTKRQNRDYFATIMEKLEDIEESIEIIAREIARQAKRNE